MGTHERRARRDLTDRRPRACDASTAFLSCRWSERPTQVHAGFTTPTSATRWQAAADVDGERLFAELVATRPRARRRDDQGAARNAIEEHPTCVHWGTYIPAGSQNQARLWSATSGARYRYRAQPKAARRKPRFHRASNITHDPTAWRLSTVSRPKNSPLERVDDGCRRMNHRGDGVRLGAIFHVQDRTIRNVAGHRPLRAGNVARDGVTVHDFQHRAPASRAAAVAARAGGAVADPP